MIGKTRESHARGMMATALATAGLQAGGCLTLFGGKYPTHVPLNPNLTVL